MVRITEEEPLKSRYRCMYDLSAKHYDHESGIEKTLKDFPLIQSVIAVMNRRTLEQQINHKKSMLCVGIDPVQERIPAQYRDCSTESLIAFSRTIIETVSPYAFLKPNIAYFEAMGSAGWDALPTIAINQRAQGIQHRRCQTWRYRQYE